MTNFDRTISVAFLACVALAGFHYETASPPTPAKAVVVPVAAPTAAPVVDPAMDVTPLRKSSLIKPKSPKVIWV